MNLTKCPQCGWVHPPKSRITDANEIVDAVCKVFNCTRRMLEGASRLRHIVEARQLAMALIRKETTMSYEQIGLIFGRDHTTVIYSCRETKKRMKRDAQFADIVWHHFPDYAKSLQPEAGAA